MEDFTEIINAIISAAKDIVDEAEYLKAHIGVGPEKAQTDPEDKEEVGQTQDAEPEQTPEPEQKPLTKEDVRKVLVERSNAGDGAHRREVKALVRKYSSDGTLSGVDPGQYEALVEEVGVIGDA